MTILLTLLYILSDENYPLLSDAIAGGLFHPRCKDSTSTYFEGISTPPDKEVITRSEQAQLNEQERLENRVKYCERSEKMYSRLEKYALDSENKAEYGARAQSWQNQTQLARKKLDDFVAKSAQSGIINIRSGNMDIFIDKFTSCLESTATNKLVETTFSIATDKELKKLKGWKFDWLSKELNGTEIFKLQLKNSTEIQGLIAITKFPRDKAVYVNLAESAPHNLGKNKKYIGVGGHLFAIAVQRSVELGYNGFVFMDAKNLDLVKHYRKALGATLLGIPHPYRMFIDEVPAMKLLEVYNFSKE